MIIILSLIDAINLGVIFVLRFIYSPPFSPYIKGEKGGGGSNGKFDEVLYKPEVTQGVVTPYISYTRNTFTLINPLTAFSQVFKPKPYLNAGGKYIFLAPPGTLISFWDKLTRFLRKTC